MKNKLTKHDEKVLATFLRKHRKDRTLSLLQTKGFLFLLVCCPDAIHPSEWLPLVLEGAEFDSDEEAEPILDALLALYNQINHQVVRGTAKLPKECRVLPDIMSNFVDPAPLHQWSQGFMKGYSWLSPSWEKHLEGEELHAFKMGVMVLGLSAGRDAFEQAFANKTPQEHQELAKDMLNWMPGLLKEFAATALLMREQPQPDLSREASSY